MKLNALYKSVVNGLYVYGPNDMCNDSLCETFEPLPEFSQLNWADGPVQFCFEASVLNLGQLELVGANNNSETLPLFGSLPQTVPALPGMSILTAPDNSDDGCNTTVLLQIGELDVFTGMAVSVTMGSSGPFPMQRITLNANNQEALSGSIPGLCMVEGETYCLTFTMQPEGT